MAHGWLTPSTVAALYECPQSRRLSSGPGTRRQPRPSNVGEIAHEAVQRWLQSGEWSRADGAEILGRRFDEVRSGTGIPSAALPNLAQTRKRLELRVPALVEVIESAGAPARISSEVLVRDDGERLFGYVDIAVRGTTDLVIDLKTDEGFESNHEGAIPDRYRRQLLLYAHLMESTYGRPPTRAVLFTLRRGPIEIEVSPTRVSAELMRAVAARDLVDRPASPAPSVCRFCRRRVECEPQWEAVSTWDHPDALRGTIERLEFAQNGVVTIGVLDKGVLQVIRQLSATSVPDELTVGDRVAVLRVRASGGASPTDWVAQPSATVLRLPS